MEDEVQLQSLAKRLVNIYNACKWSKTKLHIRKKRRTFRNSDDQEYLQDYTEIESESSARTVFVYDRSNRRRADATPNAENAGLRYYLEESDQYIDDAHEPFLNEQSVNVCTCKRCCCEAGNSGAAYEFADRRRPPDTRKKNSKLIVNLTPRNQQEVTTKTGGCCCCTQNYGTSPPVKKKSSIKPPKQPFRDCPCQCGISEPENVEPINQPPSPPPNEPFNPYYPPPPPPFPFKPSNLSKGGNCPVTCPGYAQRRRNENSCCCQCVPPKPVNNTCCQCSPSPVAVSGCCQCPSSNPCQSDCCQCPQIPENISDCCQCSPAAANIGCQCCPFSPCRDFEEFFPDDGNNTAVLRTDKIIIPTCYFNEGEPPTPSGNLSYETSEEVKNVMLGENSNEEQRKLSDKNINTSCVFVQSCTSSMKKEAAAPPPVPSTVPPSNNRPCFCPRNETVDQTINTSCAVVQSCTSSMKKAMMPPNLSTDKGCQGICCSCQAKIQAVQRPPPIQQGPAPPPRPMVQMPVVPVPPPVHVYPVDERPKYPPQPITPAYAYPPQPPLYPNNYMVPPPRVLDHTSVLRTQSDPCCQFGSKGGGDERKIAGINADTEAEIYATLQKLENTLRNEADMHSRNLRCLVDQVCRQAGDIKEMKVLVTGVVESSKTPTCKQVGKKIIKLEKRKEREAKKNRELEVQEREWRKKEEKVEVVEVVSSHRCCKCGEKTKTKRPMGCCGNCCAKRCCGCCGKCCGGCCPKCCDKCCYPCEKKCPCCCAIARCCDACWSCSCCPRRRRKKCKCSK
ncbi:uncharacterized protein LOC123314238 [Coccinella septempunctata]|uniref:uncharacterized protein LOC123314238 n=1 Tax=Coccinella septempunctata TaxID=41139 RepID=UPI001D08F8D6|nr:uncharacterized protein LOC123314238 [Coccinella septempunctata]